MNVTNKRSSPKPTRLGAREARSVTRLAPQGPRTPWNAVTFSLAVGTSVIALAFGQACGRGGRAGGHAHAEEPALTGASADTSAAVGVVLAGKIVAPTADANQQIAAAVGGSSGVDDAGGATYRVPIWVPDGINGMQPSLDVTYSSHGGRGLFGRRWSLGGLSSIRRCGKTLAIDGDKRPVDFWGDTFCLDGQRLVRTSGDWNGLGTFQTRVNPFSKIVASAVDDQGIATFQVHDPSGRLLTYAYHPESRLRGTPMGSQSVATYAYYLDKIEDPYGNAILITYADPTSEADAEHEELVPIRMTWGAAGDDVGLRSAEFVYGSGLQPDIGHEAWVHGLGVVPGELISSIVLRGPDGAGNVGILKQYNFTYDSVTTSGEWLLMSISECDAANVCKRPTQINWEPGSWGFAANDLTALGVDDVNFTTSLTRPVGVATPDTYRRILTADMNHDGLDDIVYRRLKEAPPPGQEQRLEWYMRLSTGASFGPAISLDTTTPIASSTAYTDGYANEGVLNATLPGTADLVLADLDGDDLIDILVPTSSVDASGPAYSGYTAEMNLLQNGFGHFPFLDVSVSPDDLSIADIDGDGRPEVIRRAADALSNTPWKFDFTKTASTTMEIDGHSVIGSLFAYDLDGDGVAEVMSGTSTGSVIVYSRTMGGTVPLPLVNPGSIIRWPMDINGDGLTDFVYLQSTDVSTLQVYINTGNGFAPPKATTLPPTASIGYGFTFGSDSGVRIADVNLDGRDDMVLMNDGGTPARRTVFVLLSDGIGGFQVVDTSQPIGDHTNGYLNPLDAGFQRITHANDHGYRTSTVLDVNGDGLPDLLQLEGGELVLRTHQGNAPDVVTSIVEGSQRTTSITYSAPSDPIVYGVDPALCTDSHLSCFVRGMSLVSSVNVSGGDISRTQWFRYVGGVSDRGGLGFLGFERTEVYGVGSEHVTKTFFVTNRSAVGAGYTYPNALTPEVTETQVDTATGTNSHQRADRTMYPDFHLVDDADSNAIGYVLLPHSISDDVYDCPPVPYPGATGGPDIGAFTTCDPATLRHLSSVVRTIDHDAFGNVTGDTRQFFDNDNNWMQTDTETTTYAPDTAAWLVQKPLQRLTTSTTPDESKTRALDFTTNPSTGDVLSIEVERAANDPSTHKLRTIGRDARGRVTGIGDHDFGTGMDGGLAFSYDDADGVYPSWTEDAVGNMRRTWRHAGFGYVVEEDDPNGEPTTFQYDTLGRLLQKSAPTGESTSFQYSTVLPAGGGYVVSALPSGSEPQTSTIDPFGNTTGVTTRIDASRVLGQTRTYDAFGRVQSTAVTSRVTTDKVADGRTVLETHVFTYDDAGRVLSDCHDVPAGSHGGVAFAAGRRCASTTYDGLTAVTTDEAGRSSTMLYDAMGRIQREQTPSVADATFTYGAFGLLEGESTPDGSTNVTYDTLGRKTRVSRTGAGVRGIGYDALGNVVSEYKVNPDGSAAETLTFQRDPLGRLIHESSTSAYPAGAAGSPPSIDRTYSWDYNSTGDAVNTVGRLVDVVDNGSQSTIHFDYNAAGQLYEKSWTFLNPQDEGPDPVLSPEQFSVAYTFDAQGRTLTMAYPSYPSYPGVSPFTIRYAYDAHTGLASAVYDVSNDSVPLWSVGALDARGDITSETMQWPTAPGEPTLPPVTRTTSYFLENGLRHTATLTGSSTAQVTYSYQEDGLPDQIGMTSGVGSWTSGFSYDDLARLTSWTPDLSAPTVSYGYDSAGNLTSRTWSNETVTYGTSADGRTITSTRDGGPTLVDAYKMDAFGRTTDTPAATFHLTNDDKIGGVVEKATGVVDTVLYDGLGRRMLTLFGNSGPLFPDGGTAGSVVTLDDIYERHNDTSATTTCRVRANGRLVGDFACPANGPASAASSVYYLLDNVGNVLATAGATGSVTVAARRDPYGNLIPSSSQPYLHGDPETSSSSALASSPSAELYGSFDHLRDAQWGTVDMNARAYSPRLGRFLSPDPVIARPMDRQDHNPFAYVRNSPTALSDPTGMSPRLPGLISTLLGTSPVGAVGGAAGAAEGDYSDLSDGTESLNGPVITVNANGNLAVEEGGATVVELTSPAQGVTNADTPGDGGGTSNTVAGYRVSPSVTYYDPNDPYLITVVADRVVNAPYTPAGSGNGGGLSLPSKASNKTTKGSGGTGSIQVILGVSVTVAYVTDGQDRGYAVTVNPRIGAAAGIGVDPTVIVCSGGVYDITGWSDTVEVDLMYVSISYSVSPTSQCLSVGGAGAGAAIGVSGGASYTYFHPLSSPVPIAPATGTGGVGGSGAGGAGGGEGHGGGLW